MSAVVEFFRAHLPSRYSRGTVGQVQEEGFHLVSSFSGPYCSAWAYRCTASSVEECEVMKTLGRTCELHQGEES